MTTEYTLADKATHDLAYRVMREREPDLHAAKVTLQVLFARNGEGPAIKVGGYPCVGKVKINSLAQRTAGLPDITITLDELLWLDYSARRQEAVLAHELHHPDVVRNDQGKAKRDSLGRPKLCMRLHDIQVGIFKDIVEDYGADSVDHDQLQQVRDYVQGVLPYG